MSVRILSPKKCDNRGPEWHVFRYNGLILPGYSHMICHRPQTYPLPMSQGNNRTTARNSQFKFHDHWNTSTDYMAAIDPSKHTIHSPSRRIYLRLCFSTLPKPRSLWLLKSRGCSAISYRQLYCFINQFCAGTPDTVQLPWRISGLLHTTPSPPKQLLG